MKYLIVVAHPDDEVLGAGASIYKWTKQGDVVDVCIMSAEAKARAFRPDDKELDDDTRAALGFLGVNKEYEGKFPNIEMNTVPHLQCPQSIEPFLILVMFGWCNLLVHRCFIFGNVRKLSVICIPLHWII